MKTRVPPPIIMVCSWIAMWLLHRVLPMPLLAVLPVALPKYLLGVPLIGVGAALSLSGLP